MATHRTDVSVQGLVSRAYDIDRLLALYRTELACLPAEHIPDADSVRDGIAEISDLVTVMEDLWCIVAERSARLCGEMQARTADEQVDQEFAASGEKLHRYLTFAAAAGIRVSPLSN